MTIRATVHAFIRTQAPLHIAHPYPGGLSITLDMNRVASKAPGGFPATGIQTMPIVTPSGSQRVPVIAGNNLAGHLRRAGAALVLESLAKRGEKVNLDTYSVLMCGAANGHPSTEDITYAEYLKASRNAYFGLFGGGPKLFRRSVRIHNALPTTPEVGELRGDLAHPAFHENVMVGRVDADTGAVRNARLIEAWGFRRVDDLRDLAHIAEASEQVQDFEATLLARQQAILDSKVTSNEGGEKGARVGTKAYSFIQFVPPGVVFDALFELDVETPAQIGLFLSALERFAQNDRLGGYTRNGFGAISLENVVMSVEGEEGISIFDGRRLRANESTVAGYLSAWASEADTMAAADLDAVSIDTAPKKEKKPKKGVAQAEA